MDSAQQKIIRQAPRMLQYYTASCQRRVIPDTQKARLWAIKHHGAYGFGRYTHHYFCPDGSGSEYLVGDFYCLISSTRRSRRFEGVDLGPDKVITYDTLSRVQQLLQRSLKVEQLSCRCIYLGQPKFGLFIPSSAFGIEHGAVFLPDLYEEVFRILSSHAASFELEIARANTIGIENAPLPDGKFAIPFFFDELPTLRRPLEELASSPRDMPNVSMVCEANPILMVFIQDKVKSQRKQRHLNRQFWSSLPPDQEYLVNLERFPFGDLNTAKSAQKCARELIHWIMKDKLMEFGRRDAQRATGKKLHGVNGAGGGVLDALELLIRGHYILECVLPRIDYPGGRAAPWFLVNPLLYTSPQERPSEKRYA